MNLTLLINKLKLFYYILIFCATQTTVAQINLVPNFSFENTNSCPVGTNNPQAVAIWFNPTMASPEYYNACDTQYGGGVPYNDWGYQYAQDGEGYIGVGTYVNSILQNYREYMEAPLIEPLVFNQTYYWCMYVSLLDSIDYASNGIGIGFSDNMLTNYTTNQVLTQVQSFYYTDSVITNETDWTHIGGSFVANGTEQYVIIGSFLNDATIQTLQVDTNAMGGDYAYYYVDNIYIGTNTCMTDSSIYIDTNTIGTSIVDTTKTDTIATLNTPNVFTPNGDDVNDLFFITTQNATNISIRINNRWGNLVFYDVDNFKWDGTYNDKPCSAGVYFYIITYTNTQTGLIQQKQGIIHLLR